MKPSSFKILCFLVSLLGSFSIIFFGLPLWSFLLFIPGLLYSQLLFANNYTFRNSISLEPIPTAGYEKRLKDQETDQIQISQKGFVKFDEFYLQTANDIIAFAYQHRDLPIISCNYNAEPIRVFDFETKFERGYSLTTTNALYAHITNAPNERMIQTFPEADFEELFEKHIHSIKFLRHQGLQTEEINLSFFRDEFLREFIEKGRQFKGFLGPARTIYRIYFGNKYKYRKSIQEQFLAKSLLLPEKF